MNSAGKAAWKPAGRILLVAAWGKGRESRDYLHPPLGLYRLKRALDEAGISSEVFDPNLSSSPQVDFLAALRRSGAEAVGFSTNHYSLPFDLSLAHLLYRSAGPGVRLIAGGIGCTESHELALRYSPPGLVVVRGEGDLTLPELCGAGDLHRVAGLAWVEDSGIVTSPPREPMTEEQFVRTIKGMDWEEIPFEDYWKAILRYHDPSMLIEQNLNTVRLILSSYCPMGCTFCSSTNVYKLSGIEGRQPVNRLTPLDALDIIKRLIFAHPEVMNFFFHDDDFLFSVPWVRELCAMIAECRMNGTIPDYITFMAQGSVRNIPRVAPDLARANFKLLGLGVESFSSRVLKEFNKPQKPGQIYEAVDALLANGVTPYVNLILSSPESTVDDLLTTLGESITLLRKGASVAASVHTLAFPGAEITPRADADRLVTYEEVPIEGTHLRMGLTGKIMPRDRLLRAVLERSEAILDELDREFFSGEGAFRSMLAPLTFHAIARSLEEMGVAVPGGIRTALREYGGREREDAVDEAARA